MEIKIIHISGISIAFQRVAWTPSARTVLSGEKEGAPFSMTFVSLP